MLDNSQQSNKIENDINRGLFQNSPNGISVIDVVKNKILKVNKAKLALLGYTQTEYLNLSPSDSLADIQPENELKDQFSQRVIKNVLEKGSFLGRVILKHKNGNEIQAEINAFLHNANNGEQYIYSIVKNVSETVLQNENLTEQNILLNTIFDKSEVGILLYNEDEQRIVKLNHKFTEITGFTKQDIDKMPTPLAAFPEKQPSGESTAQRLEKYLIQLSKVKKVTHNTWHLKKDGSEFLGKFVSIKLTGIVANLNLTLLEDITDEYKKEIEIKESRQLFQGIFENSALGCILVDSNKKIVMANQAYCDLVKYEHSDVIGSNVMSFTHSEDVLPNQKIAKRLLTGEVHSEKFEKRYVTSAGNVIWVRISAKTVSIGAQNSNYILAVVDDITESIKSLYNIKENEIKLKEAALLAKMGYWEMDFKSNKLRWSDEYYKLFGYKPNEIVPSFSAFLKHVVLKDREGVSMAWKNAIDEKRSKSTLYSIIDNYGQQKRIKGAYKFVLGKNGNIEKAFGILQDVTEKTSALEALSDSEARFRRFAENSPNVIFKLAISPIAKIEYVSPAVERIFGYKPSELTKGSIDTAKYVVSKDIISQIRYDLRKGRKFKNVICQLYKANGRPIWVDIKVVPILSEHRELVAIEGVITNIDKLKKSEQFLLEKRAELETKNKELEQFTYIASHDLRAPVVNMTTLLEMIDEDSLNDINKGIIQRVNSTATKMYSTLHDLIDVIAMQQRTTSPFELIDLELICNDIRSQLSEDIFNSKAKINTEYGVAKFKYVRIHIKSILQNLITNSIKYRSENRHLNIYVKTERRKGYVLLTFSDNGLGIDMEKFKDRVFGMFQVFHQNKNGKGLGLYIIKQQIESLGGKIEIDSIINKGTTFRIYLKTDQIIDPPSFASN